MGRKGLDSKVAGGPTRNVVPAAGRMHRGLWVTDQRGRDIKLNQKEFIIDGGGHSPGIQDIACWQRLPEML